MSNDGLPRLLDAKILRREYFNGKDAPCLSIPGIYNLYKRPDFPVMKIGNKYYVPQDLFTKWIHDQATMQK